MWCKKRNMQCCCKFIRSFSHIERTSLNLIILILPFTLVYTALQLLIINSNYQVGAIVANALTCAEVGKNVLGEGGSVVDAAISVMLCEAVHLPDRGGLGGGFTAIMYITGKFDSLTATVRTPANFTDRHINATKLNPAIAVGVPGELLGFWSMHQKYGQLPWDRLFQHAIKLCKDGFQGEEWEKPYVHHVNFQPYLNTVLRNITSEEINSTLIKLPALEATLRKVADKGADVFYNGEVGKELIEDLRSLGGIMTEDDLRNYTVSWNSNPLSINLTRKLRAYTTPLPSVGAIVVLVMNIIKNLPNRDEPIFWHKTIEALKYAYGRSYGLSDTENETDEEIKNLVENIYNDMIDPDFAAFLRSRISNVAGTQKEKSYYGKNIFSRSIGGSANICILATNGDAIAISSTLLARRDWMITSERTGIMLNNEMNNFLSLDNRPYIRSGKRPISAHCPTIVLGRQNAEVRLMVGASGHEAAPAQVISALIDYCLLQERAFEAANDLYFQPDLLNGVVYYGMHPFDRSDQELMNFFSKIGHVMVPQHGNPYSVRTVIGHAFLTSDAQYTLSDEGSAVIIQPKSEINVLSILTIMGIIVALVVFRGYEIIMFTK